MKKILHANFSTGGIGIYGNAVNKAISTCSRNKYRISFVSAATAFPYAPPKFTLVKLFLKRAFSFRPDIILDTSGKSTLFFLCLTFITSKLLGSRTVIVEHDPIAHSGMETKRLRSFLASAILRNADEVVVHGPYCARTLRKSVGVNGAVIRHVNLSLFAKGRPPNNETDVPVKEKDGVDILFFGALRPNKGLAILSQYIRSLRDAGVRANITVAGSKHLSKVLMNSSWPKELEVILGELRDEGAEIIDHFLDDEQVHCLARDHDIFILPYKDATQSGVLALASSYGKPVICTNTGDVGETVREFSFGSICKYSVDSLVDGTRRVISDWDSFANRSLHYSRKVIDDRTIGSAFCRLFDA